MRQGEQDQAPARPAPQGKYLWATLSGKDAALAQLAEQVQRRDGASIVDRVALTDGAVALQQRVEAQFPEFTLVLDIIHAVEYLWKAANALLGERHAKREHWVGQHLEALLSGRLAQVIADLEDLLASRRLSSSRRQVVETTIGYYRRNAPYMRYEVYLRRGWPIASGVVEGACGHLVKDRMEQSGMRWSQTGAQSVLDLRSVRLNGDWALYQGYLQERKRAPCPEEALGSPLVPIEPELRRAA